MAESELLIYTSHKTFLALLFVSIFTFGCASSDDDIEQWDDPIQEEDSISAVQPDVKPETLASPDPLTETETPQVEDELDVSSEPWEPDTSIGSRVYEDELNFGGDSMPDTAEQTAHTYNTYRNFEVKN